MYHFFWKIQLVYYYIILDFPIQYHWIWLLCMLYYTSSLNIKISISVGDISPKFSQNSVNLYLIILQRYWQILKNNIYITGYDLLNRRLEFNIWIKILKFILQYVHICFCFFICAIYLCTIFWKIWLCINLSKVIKGGQNLVFRLKFLSFMYLMLTNKHLSTIYYPYITEYDFLVVVHTRHTV